MIKWLRTQWANIQAYKLAIKQQRKLREYEEKLRKEAEAFLEKLGNKILEGLPPRCPYIYEMVLKWAQNDTRKIKQAALYIFMCEMDQKQAAINWEVEDIAFEIEQMIPLRKNDEDLATQ